MDLTRYSLYSLDLAVLQFGLVCYSSGWSVAVRFGLLQFGLVVVVWV